MNSFLKKGSRIKHLNPDGLTFSLLLEEEIKQMSVVKITTPMSFNTLDHPYKGGLYDPALGPINDRSGPCATCSENVFNCPGHFGHIELPIPTLNPLFFKTIYNIIKVACLNCHVLQVRGAMKYVYLTKLRLLNCGYFMESYRVDEVVAEFMTEESSAHNAGLEILIKEKLNEYYLECLKGSEEVETVDKRRKTRVVESLINSIINTMEKSKPDFKQCYSCYCSLKKITSLRNKILINVKKGEVMNKKPESGDGERIVSTVVLPDELRNHLRKIWMNEKEFVMALVPVLRDCSMEYPTDALFISIISVPPTKVRPVNYSDNKMMEHPQSEAFKRILQSSIVLNNVIKAVQDGDTSNISVEGKALLDQMRGKSFIEKLNFAYEDMQTNINFLVDSTQGFYNKTLITPGIKQVIEKKEGIIRMHMMGKRVNFAARTVITPDPCLNIEEIGIPEAFATSLTYPTPVTTWNVAELRQMVLNGPQVYPGAVRVQNEDGSIVKISPTSRTKRESIAKCLLTPGDKQKGFEQMKIVHRHLCSGDVLLMNRQPTLHRPGIMAHVARILKGEKTFRMHYANCKAYNADFDGDEMNAHFPQNEVARSEAYNLLNVQNQFLVPKDGTPLSGLIQDHIIAGVRLTVRGQFFRREDYQQLVYQALSYKKKEIKLLPPTILKPYAMWSGKQIISTVIINVVPEAQHPLNLDSTAKISDKAWVIKKPRRWKAGGTPFSNEHSMSEAEVIIRDGELMCGVLDKNHYGATPYGLVHCMNELYGGRCSSNILSAFSKLFNAFLQIDGFTLGIEDILVMNDNEEERTHFIKDSRKIGDDVAKYAVDLPETASLEEIKVKMEEVYKNLANGRAIVDSSYKEHLDKYTNEINQACIPRGLYRRFPHNNLQLMIRSGAKGSTVNAMQISCLLGQIELEGRRPPHMVSGKSLPSFAQYDTTPRAGGFVDGRFMTGIKPQEFFFHCMAGREGLVDTAVKTSRSGYLQRCLVKHLEGLVVGYDTTVRDSDGTVIQFCYGEDGKDVVKVQFLNKKQIPFLADNCKAVLNVPINDLEDSEVSSLITQQKKEIRKWKKEYGDPLEKKSRVSPFLLYSIEASKSVSPKKSRKVNKKTGRTKAAKIICNMWKEADSETLERYYSESKPCRNPVSSDFQIDRDFGALTEQLDKLISDYMKTRALKHKKEFCQMMSVKSLQSSCQPGEPVGLLAAQSIGEPSTQMTLNTFHFAGRGEMNVTLGIPRLRELLMTASKSIKTPHMDVPFNNDVKNLKKKANKLKLKLCRVTVADVLQYIEVTDKLQIGRSREHVYEIYLQFLPRKSYKSKCCVKPADILNYVEKYFFKSIFLNLQKIWNLKNSLLHSEIEKTNRRNRDNSNDDEADVDVNVGEEQVNTRSSSVGEDHESSDEEEENEDDDATLTRSKMRHTENQEYDESEDDEEETSEDEEDIDKSGSKDKKHMRVKEEYSEEAENYTDNTKKIIEEIKKEVVMSYDLRRNKVISSLAFIVDYDYDIEEELWCKIKVSMPLPYKRLDLSSYLKDVASKCVIWQVPMIKRAITYVNSDTQKLMLKTEGINFQEIFKFMKLLDLNRVYSNDVHEMAMTYGIEAARRVIIKEIQDVFQVYGIVVDPRHLYLVADYMTVSGTYKAFSRTGIEDNVSPLQQMSFEAPITFLKSAVSRGKRDELKSPSSRLMLGQPCISGTGCFSLLNKLQLIKDLGF